MSNIDELSVNTIRALAADMVQRANSGHPGLPLGSAAMAYELWTKHMNHNPADPEWINRDRFILSGGHGSSLIYSLLHLFGYGDLSIDDLKEFRQYGSLTPGHPEYGHTVGVEATTGPLGAGMAMGVGMAMAEAHLASVFNKPGYNVIDHYTFVLGGDGCMMEGISSEAFSLAGTLKLGKFIVLYDSNNISIEGSTNIAFTENVRKRCEAFGFQTLLVEDGNDLESIGKAIEEAKKDTERPTLIEIKTKIGYGCPAKEGKASAHGEPLGADNVKALKKNLNLDENKDFYVSDEVYNNFKSYAEKSAKCEDEWNQLLDKYFETYTDMRETWDEYFGENDKLDDLDKVDYWTVSEKPEATRSISGKAINKLKRIIPNLFGGAADLAPSTKTYMDGEGDFSSDNYKGRNIHFGVRELAMAGIGNGLALHGGLKPFVSTFFVFSDYVKPMARLSALMHLPLTYVLTHDSIGVGEDGPTHEPIEQLAMFRAMPDFTVFRPADATETLAAWYFAMKSSDTPCAIVLSRQNLPLLKGSDKEGTLRGAYIVDDSAKDIPDAILVATGSEVSLAINAKNELAKENIDVRVVSMPSMEEFEKQDDVYKNHVLPKNVTKRVAIEAASDICWGKYVGLDGKTVTMSTFGASAPADKLFEAFGFTVENVVDTVKSIL
ncbi:MAG: transketolase [Lachnospiraceae bacterium]|nr:transketolase [Lachnospiraceae bacterium]